MKVSASALVMAIAAMAAGSTNAYSFVQPIRSISPSIRNAGTSNLKMISTVDDRSERKSLDSSKTQYASLVKAPKDAYIAVSEIDAIFWCTPCITAVTAGCTVLLLKRCTAKRQQLILLDGVVDADEIVSPTRLSHRAVLFSQSVAFCSLYSLLRKENPTLTCTGPRFSTSPSWEDAMLDLEVFWLCLWLETCLVLHLLAILD